MIPRDILYLTEEDVHAEWPDVIAGRAAGRESQEESILYIALGIWGEYAAILPAVYRQAKELGLGMRVGGQLETGPQTGVCIM